MYRCDGCGRGVAAKPHDPIHWPGTRKLCTECLRRPGEASPQEARLRERAQAAREREAAREAAKAAAKERRKLAGKARWAAKTPEQQAAQVAHLAAARAAKASAEV